MNRVDIANPVLLLLLLREQLRRSERGRSSARAAPAGRGEARDGGPVDRMRTLAMLDALETRERRRAVVHGLLAEELGEDVANDAGFQRIVDEVAAMLEDDRAAAALLDRAIAALRLG